MLRQSELVQLCSCWPVYQISMCDMICNWRTQVRNHQIAWDKDRSRPARSDKGGLSAGLCYAAKRCISLALGLSRGAQDLEGTRLRTISPDMRQLVCHSSRELYVIAGKTVNAGSTYVVRSTFIPYPDVASRPRRPGAGYELRFLICLILLIRPGVMRL